LKYLDISSSRADLLSKITTGEYSVQSRRYAKKNGRKSPGIAQRAST